MKLETKDMKQAISQLSQDQYSEVFLNCSGRTPDLETVKRFAAAFKTQTRLTVLNLGYNYLGMESVKALALVLPQTQLTVLNLANNGLVAEGAKALALVLPQTQLTVLNLEYNYLGVKGAQALAGVLPQTSLTVLNLENDGLGAEGAQALAGVLPQTSLTNLSLGGNGLGAEGTKALARVLLQTPLTNLNLEDNNIGAEGMKALASVLPQTRLTNLNLSGNRIGTEGMKALAGVLPQTSLTNLYLRENRIGAEGMKALAGVLPQTPLTNLHLENNGLGAEGAQALAAVLPKTRLTDLYLDWNHLGAEGMKALAGVLSQTQLTVLSLAANGIGAEDAKALAGVLPQTLLTNLNLWGNGLGAEDAKALAGVLPQTQLTVLSLAGNGLGAEGMKALAGVLPQTQLTVLSLAGNGLGAEGMKALAAVLPQTALTNLSLRDNGLGADVLEPIEEQLKQHRARFEQVCRLAAQGDVTGLGELYVSPSCQGQVGFGLLGKSRNAPHDTLCHVICRWDHAVVFTWYLEALVKAGLNPRVVMVQRNSNNETPLALAKGHTQQQVWRVWEQYLSPPAPVVSLPQNQINLTGQSKLPTVASSTTLPRQPLTPEQLQQVNEQIEQQQRQLNESLRRYQASYEKELKEQVEHQFSQLSLNQEQLTSMHEQMAEQFGEEFEQLLTLKTQSVDSDILEFMEQRQENLQKGLDLLSDSQSELRSQISPVLLKHEHKQERIQEQQDLLTGSEPLRVFYQTTDRLLGSKVLAAILLASGKVERQESKTETVGRFGSTLLTGAMESVPFGGGLVASVTGFAIDETVSGVKGYVQERKDKRVAKSIASPQDVFVLSELIARRLSQAFASHIQQHQYTSKQTKAIAEKGVERMYGCLKRGELMKRNLVRLEDKIEYLVNEVLTMASQEEKQFKCFGKKEGKLFKEQVAIPPAQSRQVKQVSMGLKETSQRVELFQKTTQVQTGQLQRELHQEREARLKQAQKIEQQSQEIKQLREEMQWMMQQQMQGKPGPVSTPPSNRFQAPVAFGSAPKNPNQNPNPSMLNQAPNPTANPNLNQTLLPRNYRPNG